MNRTIANAIIDLAAASLFVGMIVTGYILRFPLPPGTNRVLTLWGFSRHQWGTVHFWISLGLLAVIVIHLGLHWKWIVTVVGKRLRLVKRAHPAMLRSGILVALIFAVAFGLFAFVVHVSVRAMPKPLHELDLPSDHNPGEVSPWETGTSSPRPRVDFWADVYPVLEKRCAACHGPNRQVAGVRVDRPADLLQKTNPSLIVPGHSAESPIIAIVSGTKSDMRMPDRHKLDDNEVSLLCAWIDAGANWHDRRD